MNAARFLFERRFNRLETYGFLLTLWLTMFLQDPEVMWLGVVIALASYVGENRLKYPSPLCSKEI